MQRWLSDRIPIVITWNFLEEKLIDYLPILDWAGARVVQGH